MSIEAGVLVDLECKPLFWHLPADRSGGYLPDSRDLWEVIWENRANVLGFAHSHPGTGEPGPSMEDLTTFAAIESALGRRLVWWITSADQLIELHWAGPEKLAYWSGPAVSDPEWLPELRRHSYYDHRMIRRWSVDLTAQFPLPQWSEPSPHDQIWLQGDERTLEGLELAIQLGNDLQRVESDLAVRLNLPDLGIRQHLLTLASCGQLVEDELVASWHELYAQYLEWGDPLSADEKQTKRQRPSNL